MNPFATGSIEEELLSNALKRNWKQVIDKYREDPTAHKAKITISGETTLHMAIADNQETVVEELVRIIQEKTPDALGIHNALGHTPLHVAAYVGNANMCYWIASRDSQLIGERSKNGETPMYRAVIHGRKEAFLCMHNLSHNKEQAYIYCRKTNGRTILHAAIYGEHFDLAFQIIHLYPKLPAMMDEEGISPLHLLASKPSAFKSGSRIGVFRKLIYYCVPVHKLKHTENSQSFLGLPHDRLRNITSKAKGNIVQNIDEENPHAMVPKNYSTCCLVLKFILRAIQVVFAIEPIDKWKIREEKKKHTWSVQLMEKLIEYESGKSYIWSAHLKGKKNRPFYAFGDQDQNLEFGGETTSDESKCMAPDDDIGPKPDVRTVGNGKKGRAIQKIFEFSGVATDNVEKETNKALMENEKKKLHYCCSTGKKDKAVQTIVEFSGVLATDNVEKETNKALMENEKKESPLLIAAKNGILEMVEKILDTFPVAIHDENSDGKNIALLAVENRQPDIYEYLLKSNIKNEAIFYKRDKDGNSALHIAALLGNRKNWLIPGPAMQMQWEIKWYEFVEGSMPSRFFVPFNYNGQTAWKMFTESHKDLLKEAGDWLNKTSKACSVVAVLIATVAFSTASQVPGGNSQNGSPALAKHAGFNVFAIASLVALCFSIVSVVMFMIFFTSRYHQRDFGRNLPAKLLAELTSLFLSIAAVLVSFCAAHFFVVRDSFKYTVFILYGVTLFPVALYAFWQFPRYVELLMATCRKKPQRIYDED